MADKDTKTKLEELIDHDVGLLHTKILSAKKNIRIPQEDKPFLIKLLEIQTAKEAIEAVTKLDTVETALLEELLKRINDERRARIEAKTQDQNS